MTVALVTQAGFVAAVDAAASIALSAYVLAPGGSVAGALERAAGRGARVAVTLEGAPYGEDAGAGPLARENRCVADELRRHGVAVHLTTPDESRLHMKAAVVDGRAFLDDRNWPSAGGDTLVATSDAADVAAVRSALAGTPVSTADLATEKSQALAWEARTVYEARGDRIDVESESFGASVVATALRFRASHGTHVRLIVARAELARNDVAERNSLARLAACGVEVRVARQADKVCVAADRAWVGSANATFATPVRPVIDWGMRLQSPATIAQLETAFARTWRSAAPLAAPAPAPAQGA